MCELVKYDTAETFNPPIREVDTQIGGSVMITRSPRVPNSCVSCGCKSTMTEYYVPSHYRDRAGINAACLARVPIPVGDWIWILI